ncbi:MAG: hypothetical protein V1772_07915 [Chloroflexota bacterium]
MQCEAARYDEINRALCPPEWPTTMRPLWREVLVWEQLRRLKGIINA